MHPCLDISLLCNSIQASVPLDKRFHQHMSQNRRAPEPRHAHEFAFLSQSLLPDTDAVAHQGTPVLGAHPTLYPEHEVPPSAVKQDIMHQLSVGQGCTTAVTFTQRHPPSYGRDAGALLADLEQMTLIGRLFQPRERAPQRDDVRNKQGKGRARRRHHRRYSKYLKDTTMQAASTVPKHSLLLCPVWSCPDIRTNVRRPNARSNHHVLIKQ